MDEENKVIEGEEVATQEAAEVAATEEVIEEKAPAYIAHNSAEAMFAITKDSFKEEPPVITIGDTVKVHVKIREGDKERIQIFEGTVIAEGGSGISRTFTVRRVSYGVGVERVFPVHSPSVAKVESVRHGKVRRAKLYYLRDRVGKASKVKERIG